MQKEITAVALFDNKDITNQKRSRWSVSPVFTDNAIRNKTTTWWHITAIVCVVTLNREKKIK